MATSDPYREKYRQALADQERLESQFKLQLDALKRTLLSLAEAASNLDPSLDRNMKALRESFRGAPGHQVMSVLEQTRESAKASGERHTKLWQSTVSSVSDLAGGLDALQIPPSLRSTLANFRDGLASRLDQHAALPALLKELEQLQNEALGAAANPDAGLWARVRGGKTLNRAQEDAIRPDTTPAAAPAQPLDPQDPEDSYHQVVGRITKTLENLLESIEPDALIHHKVDIVRARLKRGMDWYVLAVTLEDMRDILMLRYLQSDQDFSAYLQRVNQELSSIREVLGDADTREREQRDASDALSSAVSDQVDTMRDEMANSHSLDQLKSAVDRHLQTIHEALRTYRQHQPSPDHSLSAQLHALIEKVQVIEQESEKTKALLEQERHKATHDSLTQLPNREAYAERAFHEWQRFKRYGRPLTLAVCDIDHFKQVNDTYGHQTGDKVIKFVAKVLSTRLRQVDFVARYGGEEFVLLMPETDTHQALGVLDKIRSLVEKTPLSFRDKPLRLTLSFGLASFTKDETVDDIFARADQALYHAKAEGRNRCKISDAA